MRISKTFWKNKFSATVFSVEPSEVILNLTDDELVFVAGRLCFLPDVIVQECHIISFLIKKLANICFHIIILIKFESDFI